MKTKYNILAACAALLAGCVDLEPEVYTDVLKDDYYQTPEQFATLLANAYSQLAGEYGYVYREGYWSMQEYTGDAVAVPTRGTDWADNGVPLAMNQHRWEENTRDVNNGWSFAYGGVTKCNDVLDNIKVIKGSDESLYDDATRAGIAETKALRAFYHLLAMDLYGNVPIVDGSAAALRQSGRQQVFEWIERELTDNMPYLQSRRSYGRVTKSVAQTMLAKLYLNAQVYTGTQRWDDCRKMCDSVIARMNGASSLSADYFTTFKKDNTDCPEIIFPVVFDEVRAQGNMFHLMTLHYKHQDVYGFTTQTWNGPCTHADFYDAYDDADIRKRQWFVGPIIKDGETLTYKVGSVNMPAVITKEISGTADATAANTFDGARFVKFEIESGIGHHANSDFPIYRLADIYLMKAEAIMRSNGADNSALTATTSNADVLSAVNAIRSRTGLADYTEISLEELLKERGRELAWEGHRRQDLIRFGRFAGTWGVCAGCAGGMYKPADDDARKRELFPIPKWVRDAAPGVYEQNYGY
jgi:hypothetical protein